MTQYTIQNLQYLQSMGITCWIKRESDVTTQLRQLASQVNSCTKCSLNQTRIQPLVAEGNARAKIMMVGDAPNHVDDQNATMFSGHARDLLQQLLFSLGLTFDDIYLVNILKCALPDFCSFFGEMPSVTDEAVSACRGFLMRQIDLVSPQLIVALGAVAGSYLLGQSHTLDTLRLQWHRVKEIPMVVTFSPRDLLNNPQQKRQTYLDMLFMQEKI